MLGPRAKPHVLRRMSCEHFAFGVSYAPVLPHFFGHEELDMLPADRIIPGVRAMVLVCPYNAADFREFP